MNSYKSTYKTLRAVYYWSCVYIIKNTYYYKSRKQPSSHYWNSFIL